MKSTIMDEDAMRWNILINLKETIDFYRFLTIFKLFLFSVNVVRYGFHFIERSFNGEIILKSYIFNKSLLSIRFSTIKLQTDKPNFTPISNPNRVSIDH